MIKKKNVVKQNGFFLSQIFTSSKGILFYISFTQTKFYLLFLQLSDEINSY